MGKGSGKAAKENATKLKPKPAVQKVEQPSSAKKAKKKDVKASASEIDDIFGAATKPGKAGQPKDNKEKTEHAAEHKVKKAKVEGNKDDIFGEEEKKNRKKTEEGFNIYTEDELGLNKNGGDTDLCPFDCDCCF